MSDKLFSSTRSSLVPRLVSVLTTPSASYSTSPLPSLAHPLSFLPLVIPLHDRHPYSSYNVRATHHYTSIFHPLDRCSPQDLLIIFTHAPALQAFSDDQNIRRTSGFCVWLACYLRLLGHVGRMGREASQRPRIFLPGRALLRLSGRGLGRVRTRARSRVRRHCRPIIILYFALLSESYRLLQSL
ncbi:hypothetical protein BKA70DRAFT_1308666, partial [Coprinopsis sp. MPI-PUGE-AT-0042]